MKKPDRPGNETQRLFALETYGILDTEPEDSFDSITALAAEILEVPIALVSLVDEKRQWFKSRHGLDTPETARDLSFCGHVVAQASRLIVEDARADDRFADNPLVTGSPLVRFYAGMPLNTDEGFTLGSLCAIGHEAKSPTPKQLQMLDLLARQVVDQLEARRTRRLLALKHLSLVETSRRLSTLFEGMIEGVTIRERDGTIRAVNSATTRLAGMTSAEMVGRHDLAPIARVVRCDGSPLSPESFPSAIARQTGEAVENVLVGVYRRDGTFVWLRLTASPLREVGDEPPYAVLTTSYDVTAIEDAKNIAERLKRQERLVTTGTLAAGVGHEINNPLSYVLANLDFSLEELRAVAEAAPSTRLAEVIGVLEDARQGGERIRKIVRGLRAFARSAEEEPSAIDVRSAVEMSINMAAHELRAKATLETHLMETPLVLTDEGRLSQVLVNLLVNAAQAFPSADVETNRVVVTSGVESDGRVCVAVTDNGPGIPLDLQQRVFDPFFTTKPVGEGTGLGLSISQSLVAALGGELHMTSEIGKGTTFRVILPVAPSVAVPQPSAHATGPAPQIAPSRGRVLVIDDEVSIGRAIARILGKEHDVELCSDPRDGVRRVVEKNERFDVIFCDLTMPHLGGDRVHEAIRAHDAAQAERMVFVTGGVPINHLARFLDNVPNERVEKPFSPQTLRGITRRFVLSERAIANPASPASPQAE